MGTATREWSEGQVKGCVCECVCVRACTCAPSTQVRTLPLTQAGNCLLNGLHSCSVGSVLQSSFLQSWDLRGKERARTHTRAQYSMQLGDYTLAGAQTESLQQGTVKELGKMHLLTSSPSRAIMHASAEAHRLRNSYLQQQGQKWTNGHAFKPVVSCCSDNSIQYGDRTSCM